MENKNVLSKKQDVEENNNRISFVTWFNRLSLCSAMAEREFVPNFFAVFHVLFYKLVNFSALFSVLEMYDIRLSSSTYYRKNVIVFFDYCDRYIVL